MLYFPLKICNKEKKIVKLLIAALRLLTSKENNTNPYIFLIIPCPIYQEIRTVRGHKFDIH